MTCFKRCIDDKLHELKNEALRKSLWIRVSFLMTSAHYLIMTSQMTTKSDALTT